MAEMKPHLAINVTRVSRSTASTDDVLAARLRLKRSGLVTFDEMDTECCYARQDKIWVTDPDGTPWEVFTVLEDVEHDRPAATACCAS